MRIAARSPVRRDQRAHALDVVVGAHQIVERRVDRAALAAEIEDAAVIAAVEHQDLLLPVMRDRGGDRHQIRLGAGIGEAHQLDRREPVADRRGEFPLRHPVRAEIDAAVERRVDRLADRRVRMAVEPGGEFAEEIGVFVAVGIPQMRALALDHGQRKRLGIDRRARVAAGQRRARGLVLRAAFRVARGVKLLGLARARRRCRYWRDGRRASRILFLSLLLAQRAALRVALGFAAPAANQQQRGARWRAGLHPRQEATDIGIGHPGEAALKQQPQGKVEPDQRKDDGDREMFGMADGPPRDGGVRHLSFNRRRPLRGHGERGPPLAQRLPRPATSTLP